MSMPCAMHLARQSQGVCQQEGRGLVRALVPFLLGEITAGAHQ